MVWRPSGRTTRRREALFSKAAVPIAVVPGTTTTSVTGLAGGNRTRVEAPSALR